MSDDICIICHGHFEVEVKPSLLSHDKIALPCFESHVYGRPCIIAWFDNGHLFCPYCRKKVPKEFAESIDNRTFLEKMTNTATQTGVALLNGAKIAMRTIASASKTKTAMCMLGAGVANYYYNPDPFTVYKTLGAFVGGAAGGTVLGSTIASMGPLPVIRVVPDLEAMSRLAELTATIGAFFDAKIQRPDNSVAFLGLSKTTAIGIYGVSIGLKIANQLGR
ncbi:E3 ubiquitin protein ligase [Endozoicomonas euniceicola]|uniref:E3 ubiquitin protein ligase n=1 Tax=Endozoicomonas euniceicola TaxID=1234143 RepID=A0ABY6GZL8_9GAMM|nr:E3 ubiquitin protein ligase [Endozoicomonas euniceicola]UYM17428.1 E3 ubiquitin protein ligase [Endozoicomonas euniceicola]